MAWNNVNYKHEVPVWDDESVGPDMSKPVDDAELDGPDAAAHLELLPSRTEELSLPGWAIAARERVDPWMRRLIKFATADSIIKEITMAVLAELPKGVVPDSNFSSFVVHITNEALKERNAAMPKDTPASGKMTLLRAPTDWQIGMFLLHFHHATLINPIDLTQLRATDLVAVYMEEGPRAGTYETDPDAIRELARRYNTNLSLKGTNEILQVIRESSDRRTLSVIPDVILFSNGIFHYGTEDLDLVIDGRKFHFAPKSLNDFAPEFIYLTKAQVRYLDVAELPEVRIFDHVDTDGPNGWEVREWMKELGDYPGGEGVTDLLWEVISAVLRPYVPWNKTAFFFADSGNNGKGTLCALMRNMLGNGSHASISIADFAKEFALEQLLRTNSVIVDENDVNAFIEKAANFKSVVTGGRVQINGKHKAMINYRWLGFMIQCLNALPKMQDKTESLNRRLLFVPFEHSFTGHEKKYIKADYLTRPEVLEYVAWYAMNKAGVKSPGDFYELSDPKACQVAMERYKGSNDPVQRFWNEHRDLFRWDMLPCKAVLYPIYRAWFKEANPSGTPVAELAFREDMLNIIKRDPDWWADGHRDEKGNFKFKATRPGKTWMAGSEPLIAEYQVEGLYEPSYRDDGTYWRKTDGIGGFKRKVRGSAKPLPKDLPCDDDDSDDSDDTDVPDTLTSSSPWINAATGAPHAA